MGKKHDPVFVRLLCESLVELLDIVETDYRKLGEEAQGGICAALRGLLRRRALTSGFGPFHNLNYYDYTLAQWLDEQFVAWPHYSGCLAYPVPGRSLYPRGAPVELSASFAFSRLIEHGEEQRRAEWLWDRRKHEYAALRRDLLIFLCERASKMEV